MSVSRVRRLNANANGLAGSDAFYEAMIIERYTRPIEGTPNVLRRSGSKELVSGSLNRIVSCHLSTERI